MRTSATERKYSSAVVKSGKLYAVKHHVNQYFRVARSTLEGRWLEVKGNFDPR